MVVHCPPIDAPSGEKPNGGFFDCPFLRSRKRRTRDAVASFPCPLPLSLSLSLLRRLNSTASTRVRRLSRTDRSAGLPRGLGRTSCVSSRSSSRSASRGRRLSPTITRARRRRARQHGQCCATGRANVVGFHLDGDIQRLDLRPSMAKAARLAPRPGSALRNVTYCLPDGAPSLAISSCRT